MMDSRAGDLTISPRDVAGALLVAVGVVVALDALVALLVHGFGVRVPHPVAWRLDSDSEMSIPTLVNVLLLVFASAVCALAAVVEWPRRVAWWFLAFVLGALAIDDLTMIHEGLSVSLQRLELAGPSTHAWIVPYVAAGLLVVAALAYLLRGLPRRTLIGFAVALLVYGTAAAGLEIVAAPYLAPGQAEASLATEVLTGIEEALEMCAVVIFVYFALDHIAAERDGLRILLRGR